MHKGFPPFSQRENSPPHGAIVQLHPVGPGLSLRVFEAETRQQGKGLVFGGSHGVHRGLGSGERDFPSLCVCTQFTGTDDQHARGVHPIESHLRIEAEPRDQVLQVGPWLLPPLEAKHKRNARTTQIRCWGDIVQKFTAQFSKYQLSNIGAQISALNVAWG